jgi:hypothetical protein
LVDGPPPADGAGGAGEDEDDAMALVPLMVYQVLNCESVFLEQALLSMEDGVGVGEGGWGGVCCLARLYGMKLQTRSSRVPIVNLSLDFS